MRPTLSSLLSPLNLAGLCTLFVVGVSLRWLEVGDPAVAWTLLAVFAALFLADDAVAAWRPRLHHLLLVVQALLAVALVWCGPRVGTAQILLVIWTALAIGAWPGWLVLLSLLLLNTVCYFLLRATGHHDPLVATLLYAGFQAFAAMTTHYARSAEQTRDRLAQANADLLATRALLADSARDAERLRVARELHDVAGHKLTALSLNLRALADDPALAKRPQVALAHALARELLGDIRDVVQALRDSRGLDLETALHALAAPLPRPRLRLSIADDVQVTDPAVAEALLRLVQEALTNSARHSEAHTLSVHLHCEHGALRIRIEDDGRLRGALSEGNGLTGMRERVAAAGGRLSLSTSTAGALRIDASLPA